MPPIMGSAAFIMAEYSGISYNSIVLAALVPALLYYFGVFAQVHFRAVKYDLRASQDEIPTAVETFKTGWVFLLPIVGIVVALILGYSPTFTAGVGVLVTVIASTILKDTRLSPWQLVEGLGSTTLQILPVAGACAAAGLVIGGLSMTGLGMKAANVILTVSNGQPMLTLVIAAIVTIVLGLGMPTPSAYILAAVLVGPALAKLGFPLLPSQMFLLYYAILSALTPPIAVAAIAASAIADEDPFKIALSAVRLAIVGFLLPFAFVWNPGILLELGPVANAFAVVGAFAAALAVAASMEGMIKTQLRTMERAILPVAAIGAVSPYLAVSAACILLIVALVGRQVFLTKEKSFVDNV